jgi:hypothetical protein
MADIVDGPEFLSLPFDWFVLVMFSQTIPTERKLM